MKKLLSILLACMLTFSLAGCGSKDKKGEDVAVEDAVGALTTVWEGYPDDQKFMAMGGDANNIKDNEPGAFDLKDEASVQSILVLPTEAAEMVDEAASLVHAMNANTFTGAAFHLTDAKNAKAFAESYQDALMSHQWMCGFPEIFLAVQLNDEYIVTAYGNGDVVKFFKEQLTKTYSGAEILAEENL